MMKKLFKSIYILPLIVIAALGLVIFQVKSKAPVEHEQVTYPVKAVEVITAQRIPFRARATAYGNIAPALVVNTKAEVSGKVVYIHPDLEKGASMAKDAVALQIEPTSFEISLNQSQAGLQGSQSALSQLEAEQNNSREALKIAKENLSVGRKELERVEALGEKNLVTRSSVDKESQKVLNLRQQVQDIEGIVSSYESRRAATIAQITQSQSQVDQSQDTLGRTEVRLPFDARIGAVTVEKGEFVPVGAPLFEALGVQAVEIDAQLPVQHFRPLVSGLAMSENQNSISLQAPSDFQRVLEKMQLEVKVRLAGEEDQSIYWEGSLVRLSEAVNTLRNTFSLLIKVDAPYKDIIPGKKPPLLKGMATAIEIFSPPRPLMVLPRKAVHQGRVYLVDENMQLQIEPIKIQFKQGNLVVLDEASAGKLEGKQIIMSDVVPVMQGLPLKLIQATQTEQALARHALGEAKI